jgi:hypothetical protein
MFQSRSALNRAVRMLAETVEQSATIRAALAEFDRWLKTHKYSDRALPTGERSKAVAWSADESWPGSVEWYILDETVIGLPEYRGFFYEIPLADLARMPSVASSETVWSERRHRASAARDR